MHAILLTAEPAIAADSSQRPLLRRQLENTCQRLNECQPGLPGPYHLNQNDQLLAVSEGAGRLIADLPRLAASVHPVRLRCVLAPTQTHEPPAGDPLWQDIRQAMTGLTARRALLGVIGLPAGRQALADGGLGLYSHLVRKWQPNRLAILNRLLLGWKVERIAGELGISEQAIYKNINSGGLHAVIDLLTALAATLDETTTETPAGFEKEG